MQSLWPKIRKLLNALNNNGYMLMVNREMIYSSKLEKMCTILKLKQLIQIDLYYAMNPEKKRRKNDKREFVKEELVSSFKEIDVLKKLVEIWKEFKGGDK